MAKVLLVDDHPMILHAVQALVAEIAPEVETLQSRTLVQTLGFCRDLPDIRLVLLDLSLPDCHSTEGLQMLHKEFPALPVVVYTGQENESVRNICLKQGASDFVTKSGNRSILSNMLERFLKPYLQQVEDGEAPKLSSRQLDVVRLMVQGSTTKEISNALNIGEATVKTHIKSIYRRSNCRNRVELSHWYAQQSQLMHH